MDKKKENLEKIQLMTEWANESLRDSFDFRITQLYHKMIGAKYSLPDYSAPFVPYVDEKYFQSSKRVLVVLERAPKWNKIHDALDLRLFYNDLRCVSLEFSSNLTEDPLINLLYSLNRELGFEKDKLEFVWTTFFKIEAPGDFPAEKDLAYRVLFLPFVNLLFTEIIQLKPELVLFISDQKYDKCFQLFLPIDAREIIRSRVEGFNINELAKLTFKDIPTSEFPEFDCYRLHCTDYSQVDRLNEMLRALPV